MRVFVICLLSGVLIRIVLPLTGRSPAGCLFPIVCALQVTSPFFRKEDRFVL